MNEHEFMKKAATESEYNLLHEDGGPFGAVIVKNGEVISSAHNEVIKSNDPTAHAEVVAIRKACAKLQTYDLSGCEIYSSCMPCPMCISAIIWANIKTVYYGNTAYDAEQIGFRDDFIYKFLRAEVDNAIELVQLGRDYTIKAFDDYFAKLDKIIY